MNGQVESVQNHIFCPWKIEHESLTLILTCETHA